MEELNKYKQEIKDNALKELDSTKKKINEEKKHWGDLPLTYMPISNGTMTREYAETEQFYSHVVNVKNILDSLFEEVENDIKRLDAIFCFNEYTVYGQEDIEQIKENIKNEYKTSVAHFSKLWEDIKAMSVLLRSCFNKTWDRHSEVTLLVNLLIAILYRLLVPLQTVIQTLDESIKHRGGPNYDKNNDNFFLLRECGSALRECNTQIKMDEKNLIIRIINTKDLEGGFKKSLETLLNENESANFIKLLAEYLEGVNLNVDVQVLKENFFIFAQGIKQFYLNNVETLKD
ncbi:Protein containing ALS2cr12 (ALS2CR12) signature [Caenorhabditis elegans]|uniref:Protein containing ALS2cr12 (ALS2CR12) signature n=1 Tax=Caenorhabditis elegans TaxID=6239 RepID=J7SEY5_CAEEL|nr:Protein containing ALS2cr12 (ALS2CR12) signature [Caenorhabditis elegans]CCM09389.1 Protein containing ALS2cr12 (ALS2CR12) signature [Caenorhabditis elegans]|eukprot:NP_001263879.1 Uncharacterized protein CELE_F53F1.6 [Caenorhabditis elegans]